MFHLHSSCISNMKNINGNIYTEMSLKVKRIMFVSYSLHTTIWVDLRKREGGGNFLNLLQKEGVLRKGGFLQKKGGSNPGGNYVTK